MEKKQKPHTKMLLGREDLVGHREKPGVVLGGRDRFRWILGRNSFLRGR